MRIQILKNEKHHSLQLLGMRMNYENFIEKEYHFFAYGWDGYGYIKNFYDIFPYVEPTVFKYFNRIELIVQSDFIAVNHFTNYVCFNTVRDALDYIENPPRFIKFKAFIDLMISRIFKE